MANGRQGPYIEPMRIVFTFIVIALMALLAASLFYAYGIWTALGAADLPGWMYAAMAGGVIFSFIVGGGPTPDKPTVTLSVPANPDSVSSFMNIRVADIQACYELWRSRGAQFITEPKDKYGETRCYIRDPDGYIIEIGQSKPDFTYG